MGTEITEDYGVMNTIGKVTFGDQPQETLREKVFTDSQMLKMLEDIFAKLSVLEERIKGLEAGVVTQMNVDLLTQVKLDAIMTDEQDKIARATWTLQQRLSND